MKEFKEIGIRDKSLNDAEILKSLKELGKLNKEFKDQDLLIKLLNSDNKNIRYYSVNNLAKLNNEKLLKTFENFLALPILHAQTVGATICIIGF